MNRFAREKKPYDRCIYCPHMGVKCDGPNPLAMISLDAPDGSGLSRLGEWCRMRKNYLHESDPDWTNEFIAERADVAKSTVDRFLAGKLPDLKLSTLCRIFKVLVNGTWGEYPCAIDVDERGLAACQARLNEAERQLADMTERKNHYKKLSDDYWEQVRSKDRQLNAKDEQLNHRAYAMQERWQIIERLMKQVDEQKEEIAKLKGSVQTGHNANNG